MSKPAIEVKNLSKVYNIGQYNQDLAIKQFLIERQLEGRKLECWHIKDKDFQGQGGNWDYNPDYIIKTDGKEYIVEVKVQVALLKEDIDLKLSQLKRLAKEKGFVFYATEKMYSITSAEYLLDIGRIIKSKRFKDKLVCQVDIEDLNWQYWEHRPKFERYSNYARA